MRDQHLLVAAQPHLQARHLICVHNLAPRDLQQKDVAAVLAPLQLLARPTSQRAESAAGREEGEDGQG